MKRLAIILALCGLAACGRQDAAETQPPAPSAPAAATAPQPAVGTNVVVENQVTTRGSGETDWRAALVDGPVRYLDEISTGADGRLEIALLDRSALSFGPNASLKIDHSVVELSPTAAGVAISVSKGAFRFVSGSRDGSAESVSFQTPTAAIGIRGTIIEGVVGPEALTALGTEGEAAYADLTGDPATATLIILREGVIAVTVDGRETRIERPGQAVVLLGRRASPPFALAPPADRRLQRMLPPLSDRPNDPRAPDRRPGPGPVQGRGLQRPPIGDGGLRGPLTATPSQGPGPQAGPGVPQRGDARTAAPPPAGVIDRPATAPPAEAPPQRPGPQAGSGGPQRGDARTAAPPLARAIDRPATPPPAAARPNTPPPPPPRL